MSPSLHGMGYDGVQPSREPSRWRQAAAHTGAVGGRRAAAVALGIFVFPLR